MIAAAANGSGVTTQMFCTIKASWVRRAREAVESGSIGELKYVHLEGLFAKGRAGSIPDGVVRRETERPSRYTFIEGKHEMFDVSIYSLAVLRALTDKPIETVFGHTGNYFHKQHVEMDVEDFGVLGLTLAAPLDHSAAEVGPLVELLIETRQRLRTAKQYELADELRAGLTELGYSLDTPSGTQWQRMSP